MNDRMEKFRIVFIINAILLAGLLLFFHFNELWIKFELGKVNAYIVVAIIGLMGTVAVPVINGFFSSIHRKFDAAFFSLGERLDNKLELFEHSIVQRIDNVEKSVNTINSCSQETAERLEKATKEIQDITLKRSQKERFIQDWQDDLINVKQSFIDLKDPEFYDYFLCVNEDIRIGVFDVIENIKMLNIEKIEDMSLRINSKTRIAAYEMLEDEKLVEILFEDAKKSYEQYIQSLSYLFQENKINNIAVMFFNITRVYTNSVMNSLLVSYKKYHKQQTEGKTNGN